MRFFGSALHGAPGADSVLLLRFFPSRYHDFFDTATGLVSELTSRKWYTTISIMEMEPRKMASL